jgi:CitMHS family citrate-Mg2+:H+ or citrate-Ca2+:H+ symporter
MLATVGLITIVVLLAAILSQRVSALTALIAIPVAAALAIGAGKTTATFIVHGIQTVAPVAGMFIFAILYFGVMTDAGMLDPIIDRILRTVGSDPPRIVVGTALLALLVHLDGSGAVTFLITIPVMRPLYDRLGMDRRVLACAASMAAGVNFLPWTGPMIRASAALHVPVTEIFRPLVGVQAIGIAFVFAAAWWLGKREARRLGSEKRSEQALQRKLDADALELRRPGNFWINLTLTLFLIAAMIGFRLDPVAVFMAGVVLALWLS